MNTARAHKAVYLFNRTFAMTAASEPATTLASYAVALLHGKELADFERDNLLALATSVGVTITEDHLRAAEKKAATTQRLLSEVHALRAGKRSWWRRALSP